VTGWDALVAWGSGRVVRPLRSARGVDVRLAEVEGQRVVARLTRRNDATLDWELALMTRLRNAGVPVPAAIPTRDGRPRVGGLCVVGEVRGHVPTTDGDWAEVVSMLRRVHRATVDWPQRPGRCSVLELMHLDGDDEIDLSDLPEDVRTTCRAAWSRMAGAAMSVVLGDVAAANIRMTDDGPVFLDWGSARVDAADLDLVSLPQGHCPIDGRRSWTAAQALSAWAAATTWELDPDEARGHLSEIDWP